MELLKICILSFGSIIVLYILTKIMGNREMGQLSMFDYIVSITIGSIAAEMSTSIEDNFFEPLIAMIIYALVTILISVLNNHSLKIRRFFNGASLILFDNDIFYIKNLKKAKLDINELLMQCRTNGYFNLSDIQTVILESNGKISILPKSDKKPIVPFDMNIPMEQEKITTNVILDGYLINENLKKSRHDENWLQKELSKQNNAKIEDIFLATCDDKNNLTIYLKNKKQNSHDPFI